MKTSLYLDVDPRTHSADIERILTCQDARTFCTVGADRRVQVWRSDEDVPCRSVLTSSPNRSGRATGDGEIRAAALHPEGGWLVMAVANGDTTDLWTFDIEDDVVDVYDWPAAITALAFEPVGRELFIADHVQLSAHHITNQVPSGFSAFDTVELSHPARALAGGVVQSGAARVAVLLAPNASGLDSDASLDFSDSSPDSQRATELQIFEVHAEHMERLATPPALPADTIDLVGNGIGLLVVAVDAIELRDLDGTRTGHLDVPGPVSAAALGLENWLAVATTSAVSVYSANAEFEVLSTRRFDDRVHAVAAFDDDHVVAAGGSRQTIRSWAHWHDSGMGASGSESPQDDADAFTTSGHDATDNTSLHTWSAQTDDRDRVWRGAVRDVATVGIADRVIGLGYPTAPTPITPDGAFAPPSPPSTPISRWFDLRIVGADPLDEHSWSNELLEPTLARSGTAPDLHGRRLTAPCGTLSMEGGELVLLPPDNTATAQDSISLAVRPRVATFISDEQVVVGSIDGRVDLVHVAADGRSVLGRRTIATDIGLVDAAAHGDWLVAACDDQVTRLWFVPTLTNQALPPTAASGPAVDGAAVDGPADSNERIEPSVQLIIGEDDEWVVWTPSGFYASSPCGDQHLSYVLDRGPAKRALTFGCDRFLSSFHRPGLVELTLQLGSESAAMQSLGVDPPTMADLLPPVVERLRVLDVGPADAVISFEVSSVGGPPATSVIVLVDGVPFWESAPDEPAEGAHELVVWFDGWGASIQVVAENGVARSVPAIRQVMPDSLDPEVATAEMPPLEYATEEAPLEYIEAAHVQAIEYIETGDIETEYIETEYIEALESIEPAQSEAVEYVEAEEAAVLAADSVQPNTGPVHLVTQELSSVIDIDTVTAHDDPRLADDPAQGPRQRLSLVDPLGGERWSIHIHSGVRAQLRVSTAVDEQGRHSTFEVYDPQGRRQLLGVVGGGVGAGLVVGVGDDSSIDARSSRFARVPSTTPIGDATANDGAVLTTDFDDDDPAPPTHADAGLTTIGSRGGTDDAGGTTDTGETDTGTTGTGTTDTGETGASGASTRRRRGRPTREAGQLFMVSVGVSDLDRDGRMLADLRFAADDAMEIANRLSASRSAAFGSVWRRVITERQATSAGLRATLDELVQAVNARVDDKRARNVRADDVVVFFFAGHGITHRADGDERDLFRVVTHDFDENDIVGTTVPVSVIGGALAKLPMQVVVLIDACRSGAALPGRWRRSTPGELSKELLAVPDRVMYVISATTSTESAWEHTMRVPYRRTGHSRPLVGHGLFTHAILKQMDDAGASLSLLELVAGIQRQLVQWTDRDGWRHIRQRPKAQIDGEIPHLEIFRSLTAD